MSIPTIQGLAGVTADPEMKFSKSGTAILSVRLAFSDRKFNEQTREWETSKSFYVDGTAWEQTAERLAEQLTKGDQVYVEGRIETQSWEKDGQQRSKPVLQLRTVRKLEKGAGQSQNSQRENGSTYSPVAASSGGSGWGSAQASAPAHDPWGQPATTEAPL